MLLYVSPEIAILNRMTHNLMSVIFQWGHTQSKYKNIVLMLFMAMH
jgi:hypothetical protein